MPSFINSIFLFTAFFISSGAQAQSSGFHLQLEQGIAALNDFDMGPNQGVFGGYAASLGGEYRFPSGFYVKSAVQLISSKLNFSNDYLRLMSSDTTTLGINQASGSTKSKEYRFAYGAGMATNWKKIRFALDLAHSIEFHQRAQTVAGRGSGPFEDGGSAALSNYGETFPFAGQNWRLINNSNHQLQLTGSILAELSPRIGIGFFYRTDLLTRWVELQLEDMPGQMDFVIVERRVARQAMAGIRLTYAFSSQ